MALSGVILIAAMGCDAISGWKTSEGALHTDRKVGIGTNQPQAELAVKGTIVAEEVRVTVEGWADHVFDPAYELRRLDELEAFVRASRHLPGVPTARETAEGGVDLGDSQRILLSKVEELTLYLFEMRRENEALRTRIEMLEAQSDRP
jgi:hypothetical protein